MLNEDTQVSTDNVIGRLYNIIYELKNTDGANSEEVFSKVFSLEKEDRSAILNSFAELFKMCTLGIGQIERLQSKNIERYKSTLNNVIEGISKVYFNSMSNAQRNGMDNFKLYFDNEMMIKLEFCAHYLSEYSNDDNVEDEKIQELIEEINKLIDYILSSKLSNELEKILIYQLNNVRESLLKYKIYGCDGVLSNISTTLGTLILNREKVNDEKSKITVEKVFEIVSKINAIFTFKNNSGNLLTTICKKITGDE